MASFDRIAAVGLSLEKRLSACFQAAPPISGRTVKVSLARTEDLERDDAEATDVLSLTIYLYRVDYNKATRAARSAMGARNGRSHLPLDLHFLITPWAQNAQHELQILGRAMQCLEDHPMLSGPYLHPLGVWEPNEVVQIVIGEISTEEVMRTFDSLPHHYKLSVPYVARVVGIEGRVSDPAPETTEAVGRLRATATP